MRGSRSGLKFKLVVLGASMGLLGGCVTSDSSRYQHRLSAVMRPDSSANRHVAMAFGLNDQPHGVGSESPTLSLVANAPDNR